MNITYLANYRLPTEKAHGIQIAKMCEAFVDGGAVLTLVCPNRITEIEEDFFDYYAIEKRYALVKLAVKDFIDRIPFGFVITSLLFTFAAVRFLRRKRTTDWIYCRDLFSLCAARLYGKAPIAYEVHSLPERSVWYYRLLFRKVDRCIAINDYLRKQSISILGVAPENCIVAHDGVDLKQFSLALTSESCRTRLGLPQQEVIALYTGHLYDAKGVTTLMEAAKRVPSIRVYLVGGTQADLAKTRSRLEALGLPDTILLGHKRPGEIPLYVCAATILVLPNTAHSVASRLHTSPMKLFEYMASGRPIVASDLPSIREILNEDNAFLVPPDDPEALAAALVHVSQHQEAAATRAARARRDVAQYSWDVRARRVIDCLVKY